MEIHNYTASSLTSPSPTFTAYSSEDLGDVAARVIGELNLSISDDPFDDDFYSSLHQHDEFPSPPPHENDTVEVRDDDDDSEFEFAVVSRDDDNSSPISANEIFNNGQIRPMFPIFNTDLIYGNENDAVSRDLERKTIRLPLRKLLTEERESASISSDDGLDGIPEETYCVWAPKKKEDHDLVIGKNKSNSTGSCSKRFRIRDLLYNRSSSDGKDTFQFLNPGAGDQKRREKMSPATKRKVLEGKKKSYLPYRQDLVGFFAVRPFQ